VACGYKDDGDINLEAHHIVPKSLNPRLAYRVSNGVALCSECHRTDDDAYHAVYGYKGSHELFDSWLRVKRGKVKSNDFKIDNFTLFTLVLITVIIGVTLAYSF
jgi:5-methylcytosine-specific restriction endonuclease McrA